MINIHNIHSQIKHLAHKNVKYHNSVSNSSGREGYLFFLNDPIYLFLERGGWRGEREGEKHQCVVASRTPSNGDLAHNTGMCPDWDLYQWPIGLWAGTQSTEPHQPGPYTCS